MIQIKLKQLVDDAQNLDALSRVKLPIKVSYWISRLIAKGNSELKLYGEKRDELIKSLGEPIEGGGHKVKDENLEAYKTGLDELLDVDVSFSNISKINVSELGQINIEASLLVEWLFEMEEAK